MQDVWNGYYYYFGEDERCVVTFNVTACDPANQRASHGGRLIGLTPEEYVSPQGMPSGVAFERLKSIEARTMQLLAERRVPAWLVGKQMYRGMRELLFQLDAPHVAAFEAVAAQVEQELGGTKVVPYQGWQFFNDRIRPDESARSHIANRQLLELLEKHGVGKDTPLEVDHTFVGPPAALAAIGHVLAAENFRGQAGTDSHATFTHTTPLHQDRIDAITMRMREAARDHGATYDGWGAAVPRAN
jgi:hypothetical protein